MAAWHDATDRLVAHGSLLVNEGEDAVALWDRGDCRRLAKLLRSCWAPRLPVEELHEEVGGGALRVH
jgi:hypothetical protein